MTQSDAAGGQWPGGVDERIRARLDVVLQQMPVGVVIAEAPGGRLVFGNRQVEAIWGRPLPGEWRGFHADGRPYGPEEWPFARSIRSGEVVEAEDIQIVRGDGARGVIRASAAPIRDEGGEVIAGVMTFYDVTEHRQLEATRHFLADAGATLASSLDYETTLTTLARLAVPVLADWCVVDVLAEDGRLQRLAIEHVDPEKRRLAEEIVRRYPPDPRAPGGVAQVLREGKPAFVTDISEAMLREVAQDEAHLGLLRDLGLRSSMIVPLAARGRTLGAITFIAAESGRRYRAKDLALAEELGSRAALAIDNARLFRESQAANRAKTDFLAVMSHELRTPLTAIIGYGELLELGIPEPMTDHQHDQVERIGLAARHLLVMIEEILTVVSLEAGRAEVRSERVRIGELLDRATAIIEPMSREKELALRVGDTPAAEEWIETDPGKVVQILLNLLSNAVKFTERGEIRLSASLDGASVEFTVRDTGIGVAREHHERIFEPFWQAEAAVTRRAGGTGLGLAVTRRLAELLGGGVGVESAPGEGSTFTVRLPTGVPAQPST